MDTILPRRGVASGGRVIGGGALARVRGKAVPGDDGDAEDAAQAAEDEGDDAARGESIGEWCGS